MATSQSPSTASASEVLAQLEDARLENAGAVVLPTGLLLLAGGLLAAGWFADLRADRRLDHLFPEQLPADRSCCARWAACRKDEVQEIGAAEGKRLADEEFSPGAAAASLGAAVAEADLVGCLADGVEALAMDGLKGMPLSMVHAKHEGALEEAFQGEDAEEPVRDPRTLSDTVQTWIRTQLLVEEF
jgi:hypothetical protein